MELTERVEVHFCYLIVIGLFGIMKSSTDHEEKIDEDYFKLSLGIYALLKIFGSSFFMIILGVVDV